MNRAEGGPGAVELPDCEGLLEPTLLGPLRGDSSPVSLAFCPSGPHLSIVCPAEKYVCVHSHFHTSVYQPGCERAAQLSVRSGQTARETQAATESRQNKKSAITNYSDSCSISVTITEKNECIFFLQKHFASPDRK